MPRPINPSTGTGTGLTPNQEEILHQLEINDTVYFGSDVKNPKAGDGRLIKVGDLVEGQRYENGVWSTKSTVVANSMHTDRIVLNGLLRGFLDGKTSLIRPSRLSDTIVVGDATEHLRFSGQGTPIYTESVASAATTEIVQPSGAEEVATKEISFWTEPSEYEMVTQTKFYFNTTATPSSLYVRWTAHTDPLKTEASLVYESCSIFDYTQAIAKSSNNHQIDTATGVFDYSDKPLYLKDMVGNKMYYTVFFSDTATVYGATIGGQFFPKNDQWQYKQTAKNVALEDWVSANTLGKDNVTMETLNTSVGVNSLNKTSTGNNNTAFGSNVLSASTLGGGNTGIGTDSLTLNKTGTMNSAGGAGALQNNVGGSRNTAWGYLSLSKNTEGINNVAVGFEALHGNLTGEKNIALGANSMMKNETGSYNVAVGNEALYRNETGTSNIAHGNRALHSNKAGNSNIANGNNALYMNTADYNIANGDQALYYNTTGSNNIANGYLSLYYNKTGNNNSASGNYCMYRNDSGSNNIANGYNALYKNLSGNHNIAYGFQAMYKNTGGSDNIANGYMALFSNTTGHKNIAFGHQALTESTTGYYNVAHGYRALWQNKSGIHNIASGYQSLLNNTTGGRNIGIGKSAGSDLYTGDNNVFIGSMSAPASSNQSHSITLGDTYIASLRCAVNTISSLSDERDKTNIVDSTLGLDYINQLRPVEFEWDYRQEHYVDGEAPSKNGTKEVGFIAQELKVVQDEANADHLKSYQHYPAEKDGDGTVMSGALGIDILEADYGKLLPVAIQAIKDLSKQVDLLKLELESMK
ncbi:MAG: hypothetical protein GY775_05195 [Candidatus Scalindua sp.]|nr:hypothetical protein [Candidatus Scalindua sp.]